MLQMMSNTAITSLVRFPSREEEKAVTCDKITALRRRSSNNLRTTIAIHVADENNAKNVRLMVVARGGYLIGRRNCHFRLSVRQ